jgi:hypothetical protein
VVHVLLVYRRLDGSLLHERCYTDAERDDAWQARRELVSKYVHDRDVEVVLLSAASLEEIMRTHSRYFRTVAEVIRENPAMPGSK